MHSAVPGPHPIEHRLRDGGLVAERLARRGAGGHRHRTAGAGEVEGGRLVAPQVRHTERVADLGGERMDRLAGPGRPRREPLDVHDARVADVVQRPQQRVESGLGERHGCHERSSDDVTTSMGCSACPI